MSEKRTTLRLPDKLNKAIEKDYKNQGFPSLNEYIVKALEHFLSCKKAEKTETMRKINVKYEGKCLQCGTILKISQEAWWARDVGLMCEECKTENELEGIGDITLARLYTRKRKLMKTNQGLKKLADELADTVNERAEKVNLYKLGEAHEDIEKFKNETQKLVADFLKRKIGTEKENEAVKNLQEWYENANQFQKEIREKIKDRLLIPLKKKKRQTQNA